MENEKRLIDANALYWRAEREKMVELFPNWKELPQEVKDMLCKHGKEFERLLKEAPTVDAVEVPPIKIGDTAYFIIHGKIYKAEVYFIRWEHHRQYGIHSEISANVGQYSSVGASFDDFGKTVFLTEEEAENALAKMGGGNEDG